MTRLTQYRKRRDAHRRRERTFSLTAVLPVASVHRETLWLGPHGAVMLSSLALHHPELAALERAAGEAMGL